MNYLVRAKPTNDGITHEPAWSDEFIDSLIAPYHGVVARLRPKQRAPPERAARTSLCEKRLEPAILASCANLPIAEPCIDWAYRLVVMKCQDHRYSQRGRGTNDGWCELMVD